MVNAFLAAAELGEVAPVGAPAWEARVAAVVEGRAGAEEGVAAVLAAALVPVVAAVFVAVFGGAVEAIVDFAGDF